MSSEEASSPQKRRRREVLNSGATKLRRESLQFLPAALQRTKYLDFKSRSTRYSKASLQKRHKQTSTRRKPAQFLGGRYSITKGMFGKSVLEINLLRLLGAKIPAFPSDVQFPPTSMHIPFGLADGDRKIILSETASEKASCTPARSQHSTLHERLLFEQNLRAPTQYIYTDGSYISRFRLSGYAVFWGTDHRNNACGPVPTTGPLSAAKAEEYAIFIALLQIVAEVKGRDVLSKKYVVLTDSLWVKNDILRWFRRWNKATALIGWKTPTSSTNEHREILRVAAGLLWDLRFRGVVIDLVYVKGHSGILGNEAADFLAKLGSRTGQFMGPRPAILMQ